MSLLKIFITDNFQSLVDDTACSLDCDCQDIIQKGYQGNSRDRVSRVPCSLQVKDCFM